MTGTIQTSRPIWLTGEELEALLSVHGEHDWKSLPPYVYCINCNLPLYHGSLMVEKRNKRCQEDKHDWNDEIGKSYYLICEQCGKKKWRGE